MEKHLQIIYLSKYFKICNSFAIENWLQITFSFIFKNFTTGLHLQCDFNAAANFCNSIAVAARMQNLQPCVLWLQNLFATPSLATTLTEAVIRALEVERAHERHLMAKGRGRSGSQCQRPKG